MRSVLLVIAALGWGCADPEAELARQAEVAWAESRIQADVLGELAEAAGDALVFRLAFDRQHDLDLYVTDPLKETVYFANHRSQAGGEIVRDVRCSTAAELPGVEEVRFDVPFPGRYRVGVDFAERCSGNHSVAGYAVSVQGAGERHAVTGTVALNQFDVLVLEFDLEGEG